jgi:hypothetical protein
LELCESTGLSTFRLDRRVTREKNGAARFSRDVGFAGASHNILTDRTVIRLDQVKWSIIKARGIPCVDSTSQDKFLPHQWIPSRRCLRLALSSFDSTAKCGQVKCKASLEPPRIADKRRKGRSGHNNAHSVWNACEARSCRRRLHHRSQGCLSYALMAPVHSNAFGACGVLVV